MVVTIGGSGHVGALTGPNQRKLFYANGRFWVFYADGSYITFVSSTDGISWESEQTVPELLQRLSRGYMHSVWTDGTYVYIACIDSSGNIRGPVRYKRGELNANGTITWDGEETVDGAANNFRPAICKASDGDIWVVYHDNNDQNVYYNRRTTIWTGKTLLQAESTGCFIAIVPFSSGGNVCIVYNTNGTAYIYAFIGNESSMGSKQTIATDHVPNANFSVSIDGNDKVHVLYTAIGNTVKHIVYDGSWQSPTTVQDGGLVDGKSGCCADPSGSTVYAFWREVNTIYYKKYDGSSWDVSATSWVTDATLGATPIPFWWITNASIGVAWTKENLTVRFDFLSTMVAYVKTYDIDVILKRQDIMTTYDIDVILQRQNFTKSYDIDVILQKIGITRPYLIDGVLKRFNITATYDVDTVLTILDIIKAYSLDVIFRVGEDFGEPDEVIIIEIDRPWGEVEEINRPYGEVEEIDRPWGEVEKI